MKLDILTNRKVLMSDEGMKLTDWNKEDILEYSSCSMLVTGLNTDLSAYYEITDAEDEQYLKQQEDRIRELNSKEDENI